MCFHKDACKSGNHFFRINFLPIILFISIPFLLWGGCSKEEKKSASPKKVISVRVPLKKTPLIAEKEKGESEKKELMAAGVTAPEKEKPGPLPDDKLIKREKEKKSKEGYYTVVKGDTLSRIAGRSEIYGDPIMWPGLFRLNMEKLGKMEVKEDVQHQDLPEGIVLKFITSREVEAKLAQMGNDAWVVNLLSAQDSTTIVPCAIRLMKKGFNVYLVKAKVKGKEWIRLRVGFFKDRQKASLAGKEIMSLLDVTGAWVVKISKMEMKKFGGFCS